MKVLFDFRENKLRELRNEIFIWLSPFYVICISINIDSLHAIILVEFCQNIFFLQLLDNHMSFIINSLMWCVKLIDRWILNHSCIPGINPTWSWYMILLMYCWTGFANSLSIFSSMFIRDIGLKCSFLCVWCLWFGIRVMLAS